MGQQITPFHVRTAFLDLFIFYNQLFKKPGLY